MSQREKKVRAILCNTLCSENGKISECKHGVLQLRWLLLFQLRVRLWLSMLAGFDHPESSNPKPKCNLRMIQYELE